MADIFESYLDESLNTRTMCVGGWLGRDVLFDKIGEALDRRIAYERAYSIERGFKPIERYHANECSNFKGLFSRQNGWDETRQTKLTKRLINIMTENGNQNPAGIVFGGAREDYLRHFKSNPEDCDKALYFLSIAMCFSEIGRLMNGTHPNDRVTVFYERGKFGGAVDAALQYIKKPRNMHVGKYIVTAVPVGWEDCTPIQTADFMAYEGFKRIDNSMNGREQLRKSMQALLGRETSLAIGHFSDDAFRHIVETKPKEIEELELLR